MTTKSESDYRSFSNRSQGGLMMTDEERKLKKERLAWQRAHPKPWYITGNKPAWKKGKKDDDDD